MKMAGVVENTHANDFNVARGQVGIELPPGLLLDKGNLD